MERQIFEAFIAEHDVPPTIDAEELRAECLALSPPYVIQDRHLPLPTWARRPYSEPGPDAWRRLRQMLALRDPGRAMAVYVHIPFCAARCAFCDCYSFRLGSHQRQHIDRYVDLVSQEVRLWSQQGALSESPVSTVHFGGGTPTMLGEQALTNLVRTLKGHLGTGSGTEWALESTVSELSDDMLGCLDDLGFQRLHVGVQTLEEEARLRAGRRAGHDEVHRRITRAVDRGWIVSADLIYGLPGQTLKGLLDDLSSLLDDGVAGFSLYELQRSYHNRRFIERNRSDLPNRAGAFLLGQVASRFLMRQGLTKTFFNHFAQPRDHNLYFSFPERGEDCLALGTIADGVLGGYHYRHPEYAAYCREVGSGFPGIEGGLQRNDVEARLQPIVTSLMAGRISGRLLQTREIELPLDRWIACQLLAPDPDGEDWLLTGNGSWFVGNMISELIASVDGSQG